jgi:kumamolisin
MSRHIMRAFAAATMLGATPFAALAAGPLSSFVPFNPATKVTGAAPADAPVHFDVALRLRDQAGLEALIAAHKVLKPAELAAYLPDPNGRRAVLGWLRSQGLSVDAMPAQGLTIRASSTAATVARALGVQFVTVTVEGHSFVSADREPAIPAALAPYVVGVNGLEPQLHAQTELQRERALGAAPLTATGGVPPYYPIDLLTAYHALGSGDGKNTTTAIVIDTFPYLSDVQAFWSTVGVTQSLSNITLIQTVPGTLVPGEDEASLDVEQSSSIAPASHVRVYASYDLLFVDIDQSFLAIISDLQNGVPITQVSISLGACEREVAAAQKTTDDQYFATITALGASVFVSSGDYGARECGYGFTGGKVPSFYSSSPNVTAVGGTTLVLDSVSAIGREVAWNSSGGGVSKFYPTPSWQQSLGYPMRAVPDVAADANPSSGVYLVFGGGQSEQVGGTSVSSPVWAGLMGLTNSRRMHAGKTTLGLVAARTTALVSTNNFRDITKGNNGYKAGVGYDLVTGVGSPDMKHLQPTLVAQP